MSDKKKYDSGVARMAGNIASGMIANPNGLDIRLEDHQAEIAKRSVEIAHAIIAKIEAESVSDATPRAVSLPVSGWQPESGWILIETSKQGKQRFEGIALTHEAKDGFMRGYFEQGESRSALPLKIFSALPLPPAAPKGEPK